MAVGREYLALYLLCKLYLEQEEPEGFIEFEDLEDLAEDLFQEEITADDLRRSLEFWQAFYDFEVLNNQILCRIPRYLAEFIVNVFENSIKAHPLVLIANPRIGRN